MNTLLIIDDEPIIRKLLSRMMELEGYEVWQAVDCTQGMRQVQLHKPQVVLCDVFLPDGNGVDMVKKIKQETPLVEVILLTAHGNIEDGVQAIKNGAFDYITKGDDNNKIIPIISRAMDQVNSQHNLNNDLSKIEKKPLQVNSFDTIIGNSETLLRVEELARKVADTDIPVLLTGETGTGKEVFAQAIHNASSRSKFPIVAINCSAFSRDLLESELFGYRAGSFTGAMKDKKGLIEVANHGTLFLDEIGEMAYQLQAKLLRVLESGEYIKIGDTSPSQVDVRIISATNRDLKNEIIAGNFREDLFYRLSVFQIHLPALRERREDIPLLAKSFLARYSEKLGKHIDGMSSEFVNAITNAEWHGNVRELKNVIERSAIVCDSSLTLQDLPFDLQVPYSSYNSSSLNTDIQNSDDAKSFDFELAEIERRHIVRVLQHTNGNKTEAARLLKIGLTTLYRKIDEYKLNK
ncbi:sigma-54-dependent transcriptional regulator [Prevotella sp.]|uniref:sigma-54-dependent transcriptional regulator n=1 Tax=Prevotella sp. TaxID=59823 RepID=UPI003DA5221C